MKIKYENVYRLGLIYSHLAYFATLILFSLLIGYSGDFFKIFLALSSVTLLPFIISFNLWYFLFGKALHNAESFKRNLCLSFFGALFIATLTCLSVGLIEFFSKENLSMGQLINYLVLYLIAGLAYSLPFGLIFSGFLGKALYDKRKTSTI